MHTGRHLSGARSSRQSRNCNIRRSSREPTSWLSWASIGVWSANWIVTAVVAGRLNSRVRSLLSLVASYGGVAFMVVRWTRAGQACRRHVHLTLGPPRTSLLRASSLRWVFFGGSRALGVRTCLASCNLGVSSAPQQSHHTSPSKSPPPRSSRWRLARWVTERWSCTWASISALLASAART